jgi:ABC-2 type transport system permease protein
MNARAQAVRTGLGRGWTEFRQGAVKVDEQLANVVTAAVILIVLHFVRDTTVPGTTLPLTTWALPAVVGMLLAYQGVTYSAISLGIEREDGTLLRARAAPHGVIGYLTGQVVRCSLTAILAVLFVLVPGLLLFDGLTANGTGGWLTLAWVAALGLLATLPLGLALGGLARSPRAVGGSLFLVNGGLIAISGIFYPISAMPGWLQPVAQVFPFYWTGLGVRSAFLPDAAAAAEIGGSWRHLETVGVLGAWAVVGLVAAPVVLRRMARRQSGASVTAARERFMQRIG